jgi:hypothetical protein
MPGEQPGVERFDSAAQQWTRTTSHRYRFAHYYPWRDSLQRILIHERTRELCCMQAERETEAELVLAAWPLRGEPDQRLWQARVAADDAALWDVFYRTIRYGCCDSSDGLEYFHVRFGGPVFVASARRMPGGLELPSITVPNGGLRRHIAFLDRFAPLDVPLLRQADDDVIGILQYGPPEGGTQRFIVRAERAGTNWRLVDLWFATAEQQERSANVDLWSADGRTDAGALSGFAVHVVLYDHATDSAETLIVPVHEDRLLTAEAQPVRFRLQPTEGATP